MLACLQSQIHKSHFLWLSTVVPLRRTPPQIPKGSKTEEQKTAPSSSCLLDRTLRTSLCTHRDSLRSPLSDLCWHRSRKRPRDEEGLGLDTYCQHSEFLSWGPATAPPSAVAYTYYSTVKAPLLRRSRMPATSLRRSFIVVSCSVALATHRTCRR